MLLLLSKTGVLAATHGLPRDESASDSLMIKGSENFLLFLGGFFREVELARELFLGSYKNYL